MIVRLGLRFIALAYLALLLIVPVTIIVVHTFSGGLAPVWNSLTTPDAVAALVLTLKITLITVPLNTIFGITMALLIVRRNFRGKALLSALIDLPFAVSPVIVGFTLILVYGMNGWFGSFFIDQGYPIIFSTPGMVLATMFASLPFVAREVIPVLREIGTEQEQAASTLGAKGWQTFRRVTLPAIRWGIVYGVVLTTARSIGEFGAVAVVSGNVIGQTQTLTLRVSQEYQNFDHIAAYTAALELAVIALVTLFLMNLFHPRKDH
ncbi:MAG TPA: sulfate ABC transporter permease subunit CysW [Gaiellales bacterium]|jgi:sulfate transport system permease protein